MVARNRSTDRAACHALLRMSTCSKDAKQKPCYTLGNGRLRHGKGYMLIWSEVFSMTSTTASQTVTVLRELFARTGVPEQLVSDNGPHFISAEFQIFLKNNRIKHVTSAPYHPASNGLAERYVQISKNALRAITNEKITLNQKLQNFLFAYRNAAHATTNRTPAMMFLGRPLRSRLDLLKPNLKRTVQEKPLKQSQGGGKTRELSWG